MSSINVVVLTGYVGNDPQVTILDNGVKVANLNLATSHVYKNKQGEKCEQTSWHRIVLFRGGAEIAEKYISKGSKIGIQGELRSRTYETKEGEKRTVVEVYAEQIQLLNNKSEGTVNETKAKQQAETASDIIESEGKDDLPF